MSSNVEGTPIEILLIEDDPDDVWETRRMLSDNKVTNQLHVVQDGEEALAFLHQTGKYSDAKPPDLILLDLNLPKRDGRELLSDINADESLKAIPVVVLTTSQAEEDILRARELNCHCYISKPIHIDQIIMILKSLDDYSITITKGALKPNEE
ncbi:MAG: response regulator [Pirellulales bacterium]|nr:response regulator [Pirellulales bacterium]